MKLQDELVAAKALVDTPDKWVKRFFARNSEGTPCPPTDRDAVCFCLLGALSHVKGMKIDRWQTPHESANLMAEVIQGEPTDPQRPLMGYNVVTNFNDKAQHAEMLEMLDKSIALAKERDL